MARISPLASQLSQQCLYAVAAGLSVAESSEAKTHELHSRASVAFYARLQESQHSDDFIDLVTQKGCKKGAAKLTGEDVWKLFTKAKRVVMNYITDCWVRSCNKLAGGKVEIPSGKVRCDVLVSTLELLRDMEASTRRKSAIKSEEARKKKKEAATRVEEFEPADSSGLQSPAPTLEDSEGPSLAATPDESGLSSDELRYQQHHDDDTLEQPEEPADSTDPKLTLIREALDKWVPTEWEVFLAHGMAKVQEASDTEKVHFWPCSSTAPGANTEVIDRKSLSKKVQVAAEESIKKKIRGDIKARAIRGLAKQQRHKNQLTSHGRRVDNMKRLYEAESDDELKVSYKKKYKALLCGSPPTTPPDSDHE